jgi:hypothetical protein
MIQFYKIFWSEFARRWRWFPLLRNIVLLMILVWGIAAFVTFDLSAVYKWFRDVPLWTKEKRGGLLLTFFFGIVMSVILTPKTIKFIKDVTLTYAAFVLAALIFAVCLIYTLNQ